MNGSSPGPRRWSIFVSAWSRLPPRSRLRRAVVSRVLRQGCEAANRRDFGASGAPFTQPVFQVFTLRRGLAIRQKDFAERNRALAAARLAE